MKIWAHRGCSQMNPENTITSFEKAMNIKGLAGIELDIQMTKDGELVVIHDETVDRTTDGHGYVRDFKLKELKALNIETGTTVPEHIPTMREVIDLLDKDLSKYKYNPNEGMRLNIELKNSVFPYPGMEEKIVDMVHEFGIEEAIVYSSFNPESLLKIHELDPKAEIGVLSTSASTSLYIAKGLECTIEENSDHKSNFEPYKFALHPAGNLMDIDSYKLSDRPVRGWFGGHLYPEKPTGGLMDILKLEAQGYTDIFLNEPERYL